MTHLRFAHCNLFCFSLSLLFVKAHEPIKTRATSEWFQRICSLDVLLVLRIWLTSKRKYVFVCLKCIWHCRCTIPILFYCCCFSFFSSSFPFFFWKTKDTDYNFYPIPWKPESEKCASAFKQVKNRIHKRKKMHIPCLLTPHCMCVQCMLIEYKNLWCPQLQWYTHSFAVCVSHFTSFHFVVNRVISSEYSYDNFLCTMHITNSSSNVRAHSTILNGENWECGK